MKRYAVVFEKAAHNWAAYVPDLPGCVTTGRTLEDTRRLIAEAIEFHIEGMRLHGETVPEPTARAEEIEVVDAA
jgi:predicted RNase H-like HicB family nuclease